MSFKWWQINQFKKELNVLHGDGIQIDIFFI